MNQEPTLAVKWPQPKIRKDNLAARTKPEDATAVSSAAAAHSA